MATEAGRSETMTLLAADARPPKSKSAPYYAIHPNWQNVTPIPQADQSGALAAIAYSPRYSEAMSYLRALMADNEISDRALALTEDLISMNPAHYTVWIYRMRVLKGLWSVSKGETNDTKIVEVENATDSDLPGEIDEQLWDNVQAELKWLDEVSFRNLKNYQIWHHRHALADLLPLDPAASVITPSKPLSEDAKTTLNIFVSSEQRFLAQILSLDTKNYHVWSYRQWLCSRFPTFLFPSIASVDGSSASTYRSHPEVAAIDLMIEDDIRNNSAWSHRYFLLFGHHELSYAQAQNPPVILKLVNKDKLLHNAGLVDMGLVEAEITFTKEEIRKAPQNGSTWNYLGGILEHGAIDISTLRDFCEEFLGPDGDLWTDQWIEVEVEDSATGEKTSQKQQLGVRSSHAIEWLSDIYSKNSSERDKRRADECLKSLGEKWDVIRKGYWDYKLSQRSNV